MNLIDLKMPFAESDLEWKIAPGCSGVSSDGRVWAKGLVYVTNRAVQDRLDDVCGAGNWRNEFIRWGANGVICGISILINGLWITKFDGAKDTEVEAVKGGISGSMKRAASQWGIGRYLYNMPESFVSIVEKGEGKYQRKNEKRGIPAFYWVPPKMPAWALPEHRSNKESIIGTISNAPGEKHLLEIERWFNLTSYMYDSETKKEVIEAIVQRKKNV